MSVTQVAFDIPPLIQQGLQNGTLVRYGGVVRDTAGHIVTHLKEIPVPKADSALKKMGSFIKKNKNPIIIITASAIALTVAGISYVVIKNKNQEEEKIPTCVVSFNEAFTKYVTEIKEGNLSESTLDTLLNSIDDIKQTEKSGSITITIPIDNSEVLIGMLKSYTEKLAAANNYIYETDADSTNEMEQIKRFLTIQKEIFQHCA